MSDPILNSSEEAHRLAEEFRAKKEQLIQKRLANKANARNTQQLIGQDALRAVFGPSFDIASLQHFTNQARNSGSPVKNYGENGGMHADQNGIPHAEYNSRKGLPTRENAPSPAQYVHYDAEFQHSTDIAPIGNAPETHAQATVAYSPGSSHQQRNVYSGLLYPSENVVEDENQFYGAQLTPNSFYEDAPSFLRPPAPPTSLFSPGMAERIPKAASPQPLFHDTPQTSKIPSPGSPVRQQGLPTSYHFPQALQYSPLSSPSPHQSHQGHLNQPAHTGSRAPSSPSRHELYAAQPAHTQARPLSLAGNEVHESRSHVGTLLGSRHDVENPGVLEFSSGHERSQSAARYQALRAKKIQEEAARKEARITEAKLREMQRDINRNQYQERIYNAQGDQGGHPTAYPLRPTSRHDDETAHPKYLGGDLATSEYQDGRSDADYGTLESLLPEAPHYSAAPDDSHGQGHQHTQVPVNSSHRFEESVQKGIPLQAGARTSSSSPVQMVRYFPSRGGSAANVQATTHVAIAQGSPPSHFQHQAQSQAPSDGNKPFDFGVQKYIRPYDTAGPTPASRNVPPGKVGASSAPVGFIAPSNYAAAASHMDANMEPNDYFASEDQNLHGSNTYGHGAAPDQWHGHTNVQNGAYGDEYGNVQAAKAPSHASPSVITSGGIAYPSTTVQHLQAHARVHPASVSADSGYAAAPSSAHPQHYTPGPQQYQERPYPPPYHPSPHGHGAASTPPQAIPSHPSNAYPYTPGYSEPPSQPPYSAHPAHPASAPPMQRPSQSSQSAASASYIPHHASKRAPSTRAASASAVTSSGYGQRPSSHSSAAPTSASASPHSGSDYHSSDQKYSSPYGQKPASKKDQVPPSRGSGGRSAGPVHATQDARVSRGGGATTSNKQKIVNALKRLCLAGPHRAMELQEALDAINTSPFTNFVILLSSAQSVIYKALYGVDVSQNVGEKLHGIGPPSITQALQEAAAVYDKKGKKQDTKEGEDGDASAAVSDANSGSSCPFYCEAFFKYSTSDRSWQRLTSKTLSLTTDAVALKPKARNVDEFRA